MKAKEAKAQAVEIFRNFKQRYEAGSWIEVNRPDFDKELMAPILQIIAGLEEKR